ncbi:HepT-like ribonuclease domain-containing protein [Candidatus Poriferisodalis sp.]|uniref:HepT-like ribonuclease domain-containing protein n=1 Tax=Candidatus Poriferisodalis sp. TaxID=3101277 RepID=UPI003D0E7E1C
MFNCTQPEEWLPHMRHMLDAGEAALEHVGDLTRDEFIADAKSFDAAIRQITIIGEAANRLPPHVRDEVTDIPWTKIRGARNVLIHQYDDVIPETVWSTASDSVPQLVSVLKRILSQHEGR